MDKLYIQQYYFGMSITSPEQALVENTGFYKKFHVSELGIDTERFLAHMRPIYETLTWDQYDAKRGGLVQPTRKRALAECMLERAGNDWTIERVPAKPYTQTADHGTYDRTTPRPYPEVPACVTEHPDFIHLQKATANILLSVRGDIHKLRIVLTFARAVHDTDREGYCTLEGGPHSDGTDYIVSALVINRINLDPQTGKSTVLTLDRKPLLETVLQPGEGIFQDDRHLLHDISNIRRAVEDRAGMRDMLGIDFEILPQ